MAFCLRLAGGEKESGRASHDAHLSRNVRAEDGAPDSAAIG
jgi:hypothetical protein